MCRSRILRAFLVAAVASCGGDSPTEPPPPPVPTQLSVATQPGASVVNGAALAPQPVVRLRDANGLPVAASGVPVTVALVGAGAVLGGTATVATDNSGLAVFTGLTLTGTVGSYTLRFSAAGLTAADANAVALTPGAPVALAVTTQPSASAQAGAALAQQPQLQLRDQSDNAAPVAGVTITASLVAGAASVSGATAATGSAGTATFTGLALAGAVGTYTLRFAAPGLTAADAAAPTALAAGAPSQVAVVTQPSATLANGATLAVQPVVELRDAYGNPSPQAGVTVTASVLNPPGSGTRTLAGTTTVNTDAAGRAAFTDLAVTGTAGTFTLGFAAGSLTPAVSSGIALAAGAAARLGVTTAPPGAATNGAPFATAPVVQVQDASGNAVSSAGIVVTATPLPGGPVVTNGTATTDATGKATFTGLTLTGQSTSYFLAFTAPGLAPDTAATPTFLQPGAATRLNVVREPSTGAANNAALAVQPIVRLQDSSGNTVPTPTGVVITAKLVSGSATLTSATATTQFNGNATFSGLTITGPVGVYRLRFTAPGVDSVDAGTTTTLTAGQATQLSLTVQPSAAAQNGVALAAQPVAQLRDISGNAVSQSGRSVTAAVVGGGPNVTGGAATTNAAGAAAFSALTLTGTVGSYTLRFSSTGLADVDASAPLALGAGAPDTIILVVPPPATAVNGAPLATAPVVEVRDSAGNPAGGVAVSAITFGNVSLANESFTTAADGRATFTGLTLTGTVAGYNLHFCVGPCAGATIKAFAPQPVALQAGPAAQIAVVTAPSASAQSGIALAAQPVARVEDQSGNAVAGIGVTLTAGAASVTNGSATTDAAGEAAFGGVTVAGAPGSYTFQFAAGPASATAPLSLSPGPPAVLTLTQAPSPNAASGIVLAQQPALLLRDATGNAIAGLTVSASAAGATVFNGTAVTNASGVATFTGLGISGAAAAYTLTFSNGAATATAGVTLATGPISSIAVSQQPSVAATNGAPLATQPAVLVQDVGSIGVPGAVVTASLSSGGAMVANATAITDPSGIATFSGLYLFGTVGSYTLRFTVNGLAPLDAAAPTTLAAGPAAALVLTTAPSASSANDVALATQPVVQVVDAGGNATAASGTPVTAMLTTGTAVLAGANATTDGTGAAAFTVLKATGLAAGYMLRFTAAGLDSVEVPLTLLPGAATAVELVTQPSTSTPVNVAMARTPVVRLRDVSGNTAPQAGVNVTVFDSNVTFLGTVTQPTDGTGHAAFSDLGFVGPHGRYRLHFTSGGLTTAVAAESTTVAQQLALSVPVVSDTLGADDEEPFVVSILPGATQLTFQITGGFGTADLVVRHGAAPDIDHGSFDCYPRLAGNEETCVFLNPAPGDWYVTVVGFPFGFAGVTLLVNTLP